MGDGLPSFAPQWLKSGHSSKALGAGASKDTSNSSSATAKDEGSSAASWRAGSRLGLGADRDRFNLGGNADRESKANGNQARRPSGGYQERERPEKGARAGFGNADRTPSGRDFRPASRPPSDRELVEQTNSLKLRLGPTRAPSKPGFQEGSFPLAPSKASDRHGFGSVVKPGGARVGGPQNRGGGGLGLGNGAAVQHRGPGEKDFPSLGREGGAPVAAPRLAGPFPRQTASSEGQWTSRLAEVPAKSEKPAPEVVSSAAALAEVTSKPQPRMADAILQAQAAAVQEAQAAQADKARREQLALRQSKQLVPVLAGPKAKHPPSPHAPVASASTLTALKKPSGLESLGRPASLSSPIPLTRRESLPEGAKKALQSNGSSAGHAAIAREASRSPVPAASPKVAASVPTKPSRDRLNFFSSLRRKTSGGELPTCGGEIPAGELVRQTSGAGSDGIAAIKEGEPPSQDGNGSGEPASRADGVAAKDQRAAPLLSNGKALPGELDASKADQGAAPFLLSNGAALPSEVGASSKTAPKPEHCEEVIKTVFSAEEEAFLRSLGWEDCGDDSEGGLTEEEIAAFQAQAAAAARLPMRPRSTHIKGFTIGEPIALKGTPTNIIPLKANGATSFPASFPISCPNASLVENGQSRGYQSELEFSDSDEDSV